MLKITRITDPADIKTYREWSQGAPLPGLDGLSGRIPEHTLYASRWPHVHIAFNEEGSVCWRIETVADPELPEVEEVEA